MFELNLSVFQGPLDLLLHLIESEELDITAVSLAQVTDQYWAYLHSSAGLDLEALAEFIAVGAKLLYIKSRALLPDLRPRPKQEGAQEDVGEALAQMLVEYKRFRQAADAFRDLEERGKRAYPRLAPARQFPLPPGLKGVTLEALLDIFQEALSRQPAEPEEGAIEREPVTVEEKMEGVMAAVASGAGRASFRTLVEACTSRIEVIVVFLAVLELIKAGQIRVRQRALFRDIILVTVPAAPSPPP
ncbi:MAG: ScpA family protein [Chloroflexota bacterium]|nr:ScpA family protein [Chloroflexota bacterium]